MYTFKGAIFVRFLEAAESLRRGQAGALMMGMFITQGTATRTAIMDNLDNLRTLANLLLVILNELPPLVSWAATPFKDYSIALL